MFLLIDKLAYSLPAIPMHQINASARLGKSLRPNSASNIRRSLRLPAHFGDHRVIAAFSVKFFGLQLRSLLNNNL